MSLDVGQFFVIKDWTMHSRAPSISSLHALNARTVLPSVTTRHAPNISNLPEGAIPVQLGPTGQPVTLWDFFQASVFSQPTSLMHTPPRLFLLMDSLKLEHSSVPALILREGRCACGQGWFLITFTPPRESHHLKLGKCSAKAVE